MLWHGMAGCLRPYLFVAALNGRLFDIQPACRGMGWPVVLDPAFLLWHGMAGCFRPSLLVVAWDGRLFKTQPSCCGMGRPVVLDPAFLLWHGMAGCLRPGHPEEDRSICERCLCFRRTVAPTFVCFTACISRLPRLLLTFLSRPFLLTNLRSC